MPLRFEVPPFSFIENSGLGDEFASFINFHALSGNLAIVEVLNNYKLWKVYSTLYCKVLIFCLSLRHQMNANNKIMKRKNQHDEH